MIKFDNGFCSMQSSVLVPVVKMTTSVVNIVVVEFVCKIMESHFRG